MTTTKPPDTEELLARTRGGDDDARQQLLGRHRDRLRRMVALRLDPRLAARVDPSDIVQEALADAAGRLDDYLSECPVPFYPWLRQFAWDRLLKLHRAHIRAQRRTVTREEGWAMPLPDESVADLARRLMASGTSPSRRLIRDELRQRVREALAALPPRDREILVLRILEQMTAAEAAAVLGITERAAKARHTRALERLRGFLDAEFEEGLP